MNVNPGPLSLSPIPTGLHASVPLNYTSMPVYLK